MDSCKEQPQMVHISPVLYGLLLGMLLMGSIMMTAGGFRLLLYREHMAVQVRRIHNEVMNDKE